MAKFNIDIHPSEIEYNQGQGSYDPADGGIYNQYKPAYSVGHALDNLFTKIQELENKIATLETEKINLEVDFNTHKMKEEAIIKARNDNKWVDELYTEAEVAAKLVSNS